MLGTIESVALSSRLLRQSSTVSLQYAKSYRPDDCGQRPFRSGSVRSGCHRRLALLLLSARPHRQGHVADVERVAKTSLQAAEPNLGRFIATDKPDRADMPAAPALASLLATAATRAWQMGRHSNPVRPILISAASVTNWHNGMKVVLLPKKTRGGTATALRIGYGDEKVALWQVRCR